jgi:uncharacterized protein (DUF169 family)
MEWRRWGDELKGLLELEGWPVAVTYTFEPPAGASRDRCRVCQALLAARNGKVLDLTQENQLCGGGNFQLGLAPRPGGRESKPLKDFLVRGEKLYCSLAAYQRSVTLSPAPPLGLADHVVLAPLNRAELPPDVVVFVVNAEQACRLVTLDLYDHGIPPRLHMAGATCYQAVTYSFVTGEVNVSLMDYTSRNIKGYKPTDLFVTAPYHRLRGMMAAIPNCTAGTAKMEVPEDFRRTLTESGGVLE